MKVAAGWRLLRASWELAYCVYSQYLYLPVSYVEELPGPRFVPALGIFLLPERRAFSRELSEYLVGYIPIFLGLAPRSLRA